MLFDVGAIELHYVKMNLTEGERERERERQRESENRCSMRDDQTIMASVEFV